MENCSEQRGSAPFNRPENHPSPTPNQAFLHGILSLSNSLPFLSPHPQAYKLSPRVSEMEEEGEDLEGCLYLLLFPEKVADPTSHIQVKHGEGQELHGLNSKGWSRSQLSVA